MKQLAAVQQEKKMSSVDIAELSGKKHKNVMRDIKTLIEQGAISRLRLEPSNYKSDRGKEYPMYLLDFKATMTLITGYDAVRRSKVIDRWVDLENKAVSPVSLGLPDFEDPISAARAWIDVEEKRQQAIKQNEAAMRRIELDRPKVDFANTIIKTGGAIKLSELSRVTYDKFRIGRNRMFSILRDEKILMDGGKDRRNLPYQRYMDLGWFVVNESTYYNPKKIDRAVPCFTTKVTGKGQHGIFNVLSKRLNSEAN